MNNMNNAKANNIGSFHSPKRNGIANGLDGRLTSTPLSSTSIRQVSSTVSPSKISSLFTPRRYSLSDVSVNNTPGKSPNNRRMLPVGPLLASTRYNGNISTYMDCKSPGLTSRIVQYNNEANEDIKHLTHQAKYSSPNSFPIVHLFKPEIPVISPRPKKVTVKMANPDTSYTPYEQKRILAESISHELNNSKRQESDISTKSVLEALKEISRKRIHLNSDYDITDDSTNKRQKTEVMKNGTTEYNKRSREESSPESYHNDKRIKRVCIIDPIMASFSSSQLYKQYLEASVKKRRSIELYEDEKKRKEAKKCCNAETQTQEPAKVSKATSSMEINVVPSKKPTQNVDVESQKELAEKTANNTNIMLQSAEVVPLFDPEKLEINRKNKLARLLGVLSGKDPVLIPQKETSFGPPINQSNKDNLKSILSPLNKPKHEKHVSFSLPIEECSNATITDAAIPQSIVTVSAIETNAAATINTTNPNILGDSSTTTASANVEGMISDKNSSDDTPKVGGFKFDFTANGMKGDAKTTNANTTDDLIPVSKTTFASRNDVVDTPSTDFSYANQSTTFGVPSQPINASFNIPLTTAISTSPQTNIVMKSAANDVVKPFGITSTTSSSETTKMSASFAPATTALDSQPTQSPFASAFASIAPSSAFGITNNPISSASSVKSFGSPNNNEILSFPAITSSSSNPLSNISFATTKAATAFGSPLPGYTTPSSTFGTEFNITVTTISFGNATITTSTFSQPTTASDFGKSTMSPSFATPPIAGSSFLTPATNAFGVSANRKPSTTSNSSITSSTFGSTCGLAKSTANNVATTASSVAFGPVPTTSATFATPSGIFGSANRTVNIPSFGTTPAATSTTTAPFGSVASNSAFVSPSTTVSSIFGAPSAMTNSFATTGGEFGKSTPTMLNSTNNSLFGTSSTTPTSAGSNVFGNVSSSGAFGSSTGGLGSATAGAVGSATGTFGTVTTSTAPFGFGTVTSTSPSAFGSNASTGFGSGFGATAPTTTTTNSSAFGASNMTANTHTPSFGTTAVTNTFGTGFGASNATTTTTTAAPVFGQLSAPTFAFNAKTSGNEFNATSSNNAFGFSTPTTTQQQTPPLFNSNSSTFGSSAFGNAQTTTASNNNNSAAFGSTNAFGSNTSGFGAAATFGNANNNNNNNSSFAGSSGFGAVNNQPTFGSSVVDSPNTFGKQSFGNTFQSPNNNANSFGGSFNTPTTQSSSAFQFNGTPNANKPTAPATVVAAAPTGGIFTFGGGNGGGNQGVVGSSGGANVFAFGGSNADKSKTDNFNFPIGNPTTPSSSSFGAVPPNPTGFGANANQSPAFGGATVPFGTNIVAPFNGGPNPQFNVANANLAQPVGGMFSIGSGSTTPRPRHQLKARRRTQI